MSVLSRDEILAAISKREIEITPYVPENVGCASIDLRLGNEFRYYKPGLSVIPVKEDTDYKQITEKIVVPEGEGYLLLPHEACLAVTLENIKLSPALCGLLEGRSRFARLGLFVHITAGFMNPGIDSHQVLEIFNGSHIPLKLFPGEKLCQFIFMRMSGQATYQGKFRQNAL